MLLQHNDTTFRMNFAYSTAKDKITKLPNRLKDTIIFTFCEVLIKTKNGWEPIAKGMAKRRPEDSFSKTIGKKMALNSALKNIPTKSMRSVFWNKFIEQYGTGS